MVRGGEMHEAVLGVEGGERETRRKGVGPSGRREGFCRDAWEGAVELAFLGPG